MTRLIPFVTRSNRSEAEGWLASLNGALAPHAEIRLLADISKEDRQASELAIVANPDPAELLLLPNLKWVQSLWAGIERMAAELPASDLKIVRLVDPKMAQTMSEAVLAWTLYLHRDMPAYARQQAERRWKEHDLKLPEDQTVTLLGLGHLGAAAAQRLKNNGFTVQGWSRSEKTLDGIRTFSGESGLKQALAATDIAVVLMPLTSETRGLVGKETLAALKPGASLINFARGPVIDDSALLEALDTGHVKHAVLDVFATEPLPADHRYWTHPSVTVLPHISAPTIKKTASELVKRNVTAFLNTGEIPAAIDRSRGY